MPDRIAPGFFCSRAIMRIDLAILQTPRQFWMTNNPNHIPTWREFALQATTSPDEEELFGLLMDKLKTDISENVRIRNTEAVLKAQDRFNFILAMRLKEVRDG